MRKFPTGTVTWATDASKYDRATPEPEETHLNGIQFGSKTYLLPWALYTIVPSGILHGKLIGQLKDGGKKLVGESLYRLARG